MNSIKRTIVGLYRIITLSATAYVSWKIFRYCRNGITVKSSAGGGQGENLDTVLTDTKKTLKRAADFVKQTLHRPEEEAE
jgi:hypothetical protein